MKKSIRIMSVSAIILLLSLVFVLSKSQLFNSEDGQAAASDMPSILSASADEETTLASDAPSILSASDAPSILSA